MLPEAVARRIAAGEVIDRPNAVVRELLDNSLDAGAREIDLRITGGGNERIEVTDDGHGMSRADIERCYLSHATSKIQTDSDLDHVRTLGFRGEALSSIAAVSRLEVRSRSDEEEGTRLVVDAGKLKALEPIGAKPGTTVTVDDLFYDLPARRRFLKRPQSESAAIRTVFLEKALPFPDVHFRLSTGTDLKINLPPSDLLQRIALAYPAYVNPARMRSLDVSGEGFSAQIYAADPQQARGDRRGLQVYVNRRRVWEYALVQAIEYAFDSYARGGLHPVVYLFLQIDPELVDFNIHPAKREVRIRILSQIHRAIVRGLADFLRAFDLHRPINPRLGREFARDDVVRHGEPQFEPPRGLSRYARQQPSYDLARRFSPPGATDDRRQEAEEQPLDAASHEGMRLIGQLFDLFLAVEADDRLYLVDQHAAHERLIFDRLRAGSPRQTLLLPIAIELDEEQAERAGELLEALRTAGFDLVRVNAQLWELRAVPATISLTEERLHELLLDALSVPENVERELYATIACRAAVKDGDRLDPQTALSIASDALALQNARCPHGRPLWVEISREHLLEMVQRSPTHPGA